MDEKTNFWSAGGGLRVELSDALDGDVWMQVNGTVKGCFGPKDIENAIQVLAESIGKVATLTDKPEPVLTFNDLEVGTVFQFAQGNNDGKYIKLTHSQTWSDGSHMRVHLTESEVNWPVRIVEFDE